MNYIIYSHVSLQTINEEDIISIINSPNSVIGITQQNNEDLNENESEYIILEQLKEGLFTISAVTQSRSQNLLKVNITKEKNKHLKICLKL